MKTKNIFLLTIVLAVAAFAGTAVLRSVNAAEGSPPAGQTEQRKIKYYQCPMHPKEVSDKPGKCPECGMDLVPVYEGQPAPESKSCSMGCCG